MEGREFGEVKELVREWICGFVSGKLRVNKSAKIHCGINECVLEWMNERELQRR
jgi:hypothetical protein